MGNSKETVSDMLRRCVDESEARRISPFAIACEKLGIDTSLGHVKCERSVYRRMAGEIDRELAMARLEGNGAYGTLREFMRVYSILLEKPMSDDEDLGGGGSSTGSSPSPSAMTESRCSWATRWSTSCAARCSSRA